MSPSSSVSKDVPLAPLTTLRLGGPAARLVEARDEESLVSAVREADAREEPVLVLAGGSNLLVADEGFPGTVVRVLTRGVDVVAVDADVRISVAAGEPWGDLVDRSVAEGWSGIEALAGIPGSTGATPIQNVGAYGQEVASTLESVRVLDRRTGDRTSLRAAECGFSYRNSRFKRSDRHVVLAVTFRLSRTPGAAVRYAELARRLGVEVGQTVPGAAVREAVLELRRSKGMVLDPEDRDTWSAGSFFTNPILPAEVAAALPPEAPRWPAGEDRVKTSAAWLIERAGFAKGYGDGPARLSTKHTLALTNRGDARAADVLALAREVRDRVRELFGVVLEPEPVFVGLSL